MIFGYTVDQVKKAVVAAVGAAILLAAFFIVFPVGFETAAMAVITQVFGVVGVFLAKNHTVDDVSKAIQQLTASVLALLVLFIQLDPNTVQTAIAIVGELVLAVSVFLAKNAPTTNVHKLGAQQ